MMQHVNTGDPHAAAHNAERDAINAVTTRLGDASVDTLTLFGHSYGAGAGARTNNQRYSTRLARALHAAEVNFCNSGTKIIDNGPNAGNGGWTYVGVNQVPSPRNAEHMYEAAAQVVSIDYGINEFIGGTAPNMTQFAHSFRSVISHCVAARRFSDTDSVLSYTGGFASPTYYPDAQVGKSLKGSASAGGTVTLAVPSDWPGGFVDMSFVGGLGRGARLSFTLDGADAGQLDARNTHPVNGMFNQATKRIPTTAGAHTVVATVDAVSPADVFFDCATLEATKPPLVIVHNIARTPQYGGPWTTQNGAISSVVDEFGDNVIYFDIDSLLNAQAVNFNADNLHPSDLGHALIADAMYDLIQANAALIPGRDAVLFG